MRSGDLRAEDQDRPLKDWLFPSGRRGMAGQTVAICGGSAGITLNNQHKLADCVGDGGNVFEEEMGALSPTVCRIREGMWSGNCTDGAILPFPAGTELVHVFDSMLTGEDRDWLGVMLENEDTETTAYSYCAGEGAIFMGAVYFKQPGADTTVKYVRCEGSEDLWPLASFRSVDPPYPLFGLEWLAAAPDAPLVIVGTEEATFIIPELVDAVAISFPRIASAAAELDLHPLQGRTVSLVRDSKVLTHARAEELILALKEVGVASACIVGGMVEDWDSPHAKWNAHSVALF